MKVIAGVCALIMVVGCQKASEVTVSETIRLPKGTKIEAVTLKELTSGGSKEGEKVPMMVSADVRDSSGKVLVPRGAAVTGEVSWSRSEGTLGALTNSPARLKFKFKDLVLPDGKHVRMSASSKKEDEEFELNRENTGKIEVSQRVEQLMDSPENEEAISALRKVVEEGDTSGLSAEKFNELSQKFQVDSATMLTKDEDVAKLGDMFQKLKGGSSLAALASGGALPMVDVAVQLIGVAGQVGSRLGRSLGGRNIRAYVGTPVTGYTVEDVQVTP